MPKIACLSNFWISVGSFAKWSCCWISREENSVAYDLAKNS